MPFLSAELEISFPGFVQQMFFSAPFFAVDFHQGKLHRHDVCPGKLKGPPMLYRLRGKINGLLMGYKRF